MKITRRQVMAGAATGGAVAALGISPASSAALPSGSAWTVYYQARDGSVTRFANVRTIEGFDTVAFVCDGRWVYLSRGTMWAELNGKPLISQRRIATHPYALDV